MGFKMRFSLYVLLCFNFVLLIVLLPLVDPRFNAINIRLHLIRVVADQLNDNLAIKGIASLLE